MLYRVRLHWQGADPRIDLRQQALLGDAELLELMAALARLDGRSAAGPWTRRTLLAVQLHPGRAAAALAVKLAVDKDWLKPAVRKLKEFGLTESLEVGYRLSPWGVALLARTDGPGGVGG